MIAAFDLHRMSAQSFGCERGLHRALCCDIPRAQNLWVTWTVRTEMESLLQQNKLPYLTAAHILHGGITHRKVDRSPPCAVRRTSRRTPRCRARSFAQKPRPHRSVQRSLFRMATAKTQTANDIGWLAPVHMAQQTLDCAQHRQKRRAVWEACPHKRV